jgi:hypothetical protein
MSKARHKPNRGNQGSRILDRLVQSPNTWILKGELARIAICLPNEDCTVHSRIADLRKEGHVIKNQKLHSEGVCHSFYKLIPPTGTVPVEFESGRETTVPIEQVANPQDSVTQPRQVPPEQLSGDQPGQPETTFDPNRTHCCFLITVKGQTS